MNEDTPNTEKDLSKKEGKKKAKGSPKRQLIPKANYKQPVRDTFTDRDSPEATFIQKHRCAEIEQGYSEHHRRYSLQGKRGVPTSH